MSKNVKFYRNIFIIVLCLISLTVFSYFILKLNILPFKYLAACYFLIIPILISLFYFLVHNKKTINQVIISLAIFLISFIFILGSFYINRTYAFFDTTNKENGTITYSVLVLKNKYHSIAELGTIMYLNDDYASDIKNALSKNVAYEEKLSTDLSASVNSLLNGEVAGLVLEDSYLVLAQEEIKDFQAKTDIIYTFSLKEKTMPPKTPEAQKDILIEPFILYISGIDQYGDVKSVRGRSDVNQLIIVNPKKNKILLVNTPRDYYVQLAGTTGLKDKLTHAGIYGIDKSIQTLENLYDIDINYYLRVNFNALIKIVDVIGGIEVYSDTEFDSSHLKGWHVKKGLNSMDGTKALAYARERYAYTTGDNHRGANQQQIITAILEKITSSPVLINKYNTILETLNGSFQTDLTINEITSFIKYQLTKNPEWAIESIAVTGYNSSNYTYSMGTKYKSYVMEPDYKSVVNAKNKIKDVLNEN